ncbi:MAG: hypothetical protein Q9220_006224 [cf. Caloplaca sp. 1 TL-2023]
MRLLERSDDGLRFAEFDDPKSIPPYAIMSHRWGNEEVSYKDFVGGNCRDKAGYRKISFIADQAKKDGLRYFWIDTCCIDQSSCSERTEAVQSMYGYYQKSAKCYTYLSDVLTEKRKSSEAILTPSRSWKKQFWESTWFRRGWILQELLAPSSMEFYDYDWTFLGTRTGLLDTISSITRIPKRALDGHGLENYSIAQRMSWAASRETTRVEDRAYSLLGIFDVNMPMLYGEGPKAFIRLQEEIIKKSEDQSIFAWKVNEGYDTHSLLAPSPDAFADSYNIVPIPGSRATTPFSLTQLGLRIQLDLNRDENDHHAALLNCMDRKSKTRIGVHLVSLGKNRFTRTQLDQLIMAQPRRPPKGFVPLGRKTIYIQRQGLLHRQGSRIKDHGWYRADNRKLQLYQSGGNAGPIIKAVSNLCLRCPARKLSFLRGCIRNYSYYTALPFG